MPEENSPAHQQGPKPKKNKKSKGARARGNDENKDLPDVMGGESPGSAEMSNSNGDRADSLNGKALGQGADTNDRNNDTYGSLSEEPLVGLGTVSEKKPELPTSDSFESKDLFDALVRDRDSLRAEVVDLRRSLEEIQSKHRADMESLQEKLGDTESKKEHAELQFQKLLERVNTIKSQLGERLREDAEELAQAKSKIEELEDENAHMKMQLDSKSSELVVASEEVERRLQELSTIRDRTNLSRQNWLKEKQELLEQESYLQSEFEQAKEAMHNWEILAMEERSIRENLGEKVIDLEEQIGGLREIYEKTAAERDTQLATIEGLQRALQEIQTARKQELRELVESSDAQLEDLRQALRDAEKKASDADNALQNAEEELERVRPFEKEVKEKNLLIGKLRHEAVTLNDHLTKALRFLKKGKPEDNVDRHIVTNHLLHFLALDRSDPKKFQILQLIAALLGWTDEQREQAGLARPGTSSNAGSKLKVPGTPVARTPSSPNLVTEFLDTGTSGNSKESLAELWSNFLEQEVQAGSRNASRRGSQIGFQKPS